jgi:hypothetical protein
MTPRLSNIDKIRDNHVYGLFPEFRNRLRRGIISDCTIRLRDMVAATAAQMISTVPVEWEVSAEARAAWSELICRRAGYVADNIQAWIDAAVPALDTQGE